MRKRLVVVQDVSELSPSVQATLRSETFDQVLIEGFATPVMRVVLDFRPALILFDTSSWSEALRELLWKMSELKSTRTIRKVVLAAAGGMDDKVAALDLGADDFRRPGVWPFPSLAAAASLIVERITV